MKIGMIYINLPSFVWSTHDEYGLGGSESGFIRTVEYLRKLGHEVHVFTTADVRKQTAPDGSIWSNVEYFDPKEHYDVVYSLRHKEPFNTRPNAKLTVLFLADTESVGLGQYVRDGRIDLVTSVSMWQGKKIADEENIHGDNMLYSSNGVDDRGRVGFDLDIKESGRCIFMATPERGLGNLLDVWPQIKDKVPFATLHLFSSFMGWGHTEESNREMMHDILERISSMENLGVVNHVHAPPWAIVEELKRADLYIYPTAFKETRCMSILEGELYGVIPVATALAALLESVVPGLTGFTIPPYGVDNERYDKLFVDTVVSAINLEPEKKKILRLGCQRYAEQFTYERLVRQWAEEWELRIRDK